MVNADISGILEDVVHQFSDPFAFFRELVQNAIDAGSGEIEVDVEFEELDGDGLVTSSVRDFGSGMTREIIETQLCRLFSSAKYGDYTKIGRFGIGFISVYGIEPDWICVDTGRDGESWRVIFLADRSFELRKLRSPVEGTLVHVAKRMSRVEFETFRERAAVVLAKWCAHVRVPITFAGCDLRQPFEIESACAIEFEEEGTRVVAGITAERSPVCSYYNRGLLLREREASPWPHVAFKIDSRFLEHTLTRDDLLQDRGYHRAVELLAGLATRKLPALLLADLERLASEEPSARRDELLRLFATLIRAGVLSNYKKRPVIPTMTGPKSPRACERADSVIFAASPSSLATAVAELGHLVVLGPCADLATALRVRPREIHDEFVELSASPITDPALVELLGDRSWLGSWRGPRAVVVEDPQAAQRRSELRSPTSASHGLELVLNARDELVAAALAIQGSDPAIAATALLIASDRKRGDTAISWLAARDDHGA